MASTNKTANLSLNQWTLDDPFLMEDFNADNRKLDAAMTGMDGRKMEFIKLKEIVTTVGNIARIEIDVSDIVFTDWQFVILDVSVTPNGYLGANAGGTLVPFGSGPNIINVVSQIDTATRVIMFTSMGFNTRLCALSIGGNMSCSYGNMNFNYLKKLYVSAVNSNVNIDAGAKFTFWGVK